MDAYIKQKWVNALRSGKYKQTTGKLSDVAGHCCLGVLCEILKYTNYTLEGVGGHITIVYSYAGKKMIDQLTDDVCENIGISIEDTRILVEMNDGDHKSFNEIADYIEKNL